MLSPHGKKTDSLGYFYPPNYAFLPKKLRSMNSFELLWSYNLWHEFWHMKNIQECYLGSYIQLLNILSENLVQYGFHLYGKKQFSKGKTCITQALDVVRKIQMLTNASLVANEMSPTFYLVNESLQEVVTKGLRDFIVPTFFKNSRITKDQIAHFAKQEGKNLMTKLKDAKTAKQIANSEHRLAYNLSRKISRKFGDISYVDTISRFSMNIDLFKIDVLSMDANDLADQFSAAPQVLAPDYRVELFSQKGKIFMENLELQRNNEDQKFMKSLFKIMSHSSLPKHVRMDSKNLRKHGEQMQESLELLRTRLKQTDGYVAQTIFLTSTPFGDVFVMCRPFATNEKEIDLVQKIMSNNYASELLFRFCDLSRYSEDLLSALRYVLDYLSSRVKEPDDSYQYVEAVLKRILSKDRLKTVLPSCTQ
jgi:hypothetical protein